MGQQAKDVGLRLRGVADKYGGTTAFAGKIGISPAQLSQYLSGYRSPGTRLYRRIAKAVGDNVAFYVLTGRSQEEAAAKLDKNVGERERASAFMEVIRKHNIVSAQQLDWILEARHMILNEPQAPYKAKGRKK